MNLDELHQLDTLMKSAKTRAFHVALLLFVFVFLISSQIPWERALEPRMLMNIVVWCLGCVAIALFMVFWVRGRILATERLKNLIQFESLQVQQAEVFPIRFYNLIPLGYELGVDLVSGEHLAFGFWSEQPAHELYELLVTAHRIATESKQITGLEGS